MLAAPDPAGRLVRPSSRHAGVGQALVVSVGLHASAVAAAWFWLSAAPLSPPQGGTPAIEVEMIGAETFERMMSTAGAVRAEEALARLELPPGLEPVTAVEPAPVPEFHVAPQPEITVVVEVPEPSVPLPAPAEIALAVERPTPEVAPPPSVERLAGLEPPRPTPTSAPAPKPSPDRRAARVPVAPQGPRTVEKAGRDTARARNVARGRGTAGAGEDVASSTASLRGGTARPAPPTEAGGAGAAAYRAQVLAHLARHKRYPEAARLLAAQGSVQVAFAISPDGAVAAVALAGSSGHPVLDQEALAMVRRASPFPRPPDGPVRFTAPVRYDMR